MSHVSRVRAVAWTVLLLLAFIQGWVFRHAISPDGVAYLDLSDAVVHGPFRDLVNAYWSPLYPTLIGVSRLLLSGTSLGTPYWEFALIHVVNVVAFAISLGAFDWFLRALDDAGKSWGQRPFATPIGRATAYLFFGMASLALISVAGTVPDLLLSASIFGAFACLLRLDANPADRRAAVRLGVLLALGALTKSVMFPLGVVMLLITAVVTWRRGGRATVLRSAAAFALITFPWVVALSISVGRPTTGQTGALNYAWYVNNRQPPNTGVMPALAAPREPLPLDGLAVLRDARGTNPLWYDPFRWHRDVKTRFSVEEQWRRLSGSLRYYAYVTAQFILVLVAIGVSTRWADVRMTLRRGLVVLVPCVAAFFAYGLVYTTSRFIAPFLLAGCLVLAAAFPREAPMRVSRFAVAIGLTLLTLDTVSPMRVRILITYGLAVFIAAWLAWGVSNRAIRAVLSAGTTLAASWLLKELPTVVVVWTLPFILTPVIWAALLRAERSGRLEETAWSLRQAAAVAAVVAISAPVALLGGLGLARWNLTPAGAVHPEWNSAQQMIRDGIPVGSKVAVVGNPENSGWARLARYQIVAVVPQHRADAFWKLNDADRARIMRAFSEAGATRLITLPSSPIAFRDGFQPK